MIYDSPISSFFVRPIGPDAALEMLASGAVVEAFAVSVVASRAAAAVSDIVGVTPEEIGMARVESEGYPRRESRERDRQDKHRGVADSVQVTQTRSCLYLSM